MTKRIIKIISLAMILIACSKVENDQPSPMKDVEQVLLEIQGTKELDRFEERTFSYVLIFHSPFPSSEGNTYTIEKSSVRSVLNGGRTLEIIFSDGRSAKFSYHSYLEVRMERDYASFTDGSDTASVHYTIVDSKPADVEISILGAEDTDEYSIEGPDGGKNGRIRFRVASPQKEFTKDITVRFSNTQKTLEFPFTLIREDFTFADEAVEKSFDFLEYDRYFEIPMPKADKTIEVKVPDDASWLEARVNTEKVNGKDRTTLCFLLSENVGKEARNAAVTVCRPGSSRNLLIKVSQIGSEMEGSLKKGLEAFYTGLNGNAWNRRDNWCSDRPMFEWYGVTASKTVARAMFDHEGFVYSGTDDVWYLNLEANNMRGEIPLEFWQACKCFGKIVIRGEYLPTTVLSDLVWHEGLEKLDLSMTFMNAPLTPTISKARNLQTLNLLCCNIAGCLPDEITALSHLRELCLGECGITGTLPSSIGNLQELELLVLDHNMGLGGNLPSSFYQMHNLRIFDIGSTQIGGTLTPDVRNIRNLQQFFIGGCEFEGTIPEEFGLLEKLAIYDFQGNYFTQIPQFIRYTGYDRQWVGSAGFPLGVPYYQRYKQDGRPKNYVVVVPDVYQISDIIVNGSPLKRPGYYVDYDYCHLMHLPVWAHVKYGIFTWNMCHDGEFKNPVYPNADDLQYPADEYYYDGTNWRHPKLEFPAREYWFDGDSWEHNTSCPWEQNYIE